MICRLFDTKNELYVRHKLVKFLSENDRTELTRNQTTEFEGKDPIYIVEGKIAKGKKGRFTVLHNGFMIKGRSLSYCHHLLSIDEQTIFFNEIDLKGLDNLTIEVEYGL